MYLQARGNLFVASLPLNLHMSGSVCFCARVCTLPSVCVQLDFFSWLCPHVTLTAVEAAHLHLELRPLLPRTSQLDPAHVATVPVMSGYSWA